MPELITHYLVGEQIISKIADKDIKQLLDANRKEFLLGSQGGDLFFFFNFGLFKNKKSVPEFGNRLHVEKVNAFFEEGLEYIKNHYSDPLFAYFLGYIGHYTTDKAVHPFVYQKSNNTTTMHHHIEFMLGKQYLLDKKGQETGDFDMNAPFDFALSDGILDFYISIAKTLYNQTLTKAIINKCKQDFRDFKVITQHPSAQYKLFSMLARPVVKFDPMALVYKDKNDWQYFDQAEYADFIANLVKAINNAVDIIRAAHAFIQKDAPIQPYLDFFDSTDFCGRKHPNP